MMVLLQVEKDGYQNLCSAKYDIYSETSFPFHQDRNNPLPSVQVSTIHELFSLKLRNPIYGIQDTLNGC